MSPENNAESENKGSILAPLLTSLVLLVLLAGFSFYLWQYHFGPQLAAMAEHGPRLLIEEQTRRNTLTAEQGRLKVLLNLPPCEAKARLAGKTTGGGGAGLSRLLRFLNKNGSGNAAAPR